MALLLAGWALCSAPGCCAQSGAQKPEYANLPVSTGELDRAVHRASLIARAHITAYQPPAVQNGHATTEQVTLSIDEVYAGKVEPHTTLTYQCLCHMADPPAAADLVGHEVLTLLTFNAKQASWSPVFEPSPLFYNTALRNRVLRALRLAKGHP